MAKKRLRVRVGVILVQKGKVLLSKQHASEGRDFWVLPGGGLKEDEGLLDCVRREMAEETGLEVEPIRLLYLGDFFKGEKHVVDMFFLGRLLGGELKRREDEIDSLKFFEIESLKEVPVRPPAIAERLVRDFHEGFRGEPIYLGKYSSEEKPSPER